MDRSRHICGVATFDRILWDRAPRVAHAYPTREGSGVVLQARSPDSRSARIPEGDALVILAMRDAFHRYEEADIGGFAVDRSFTRGRFALIPPGCAGRWVSEGHPALSTSSWVPSGSRNWMTWQATRSLTAFAPTPTIR